MNQTPEESGVRNHERACMDKLVGAQLEMAGAAGIMYTVPDSYSAGMTMEGSVAADFLWMTTVVCCFLVTHLCEEYRRHATQARPVKLGCVLGLHWSSMGGTGHDQPERMPVVDDVMNREEGVTDFAGVAVV